MSDYVGRHRPDRNTCDDVDCGYIPRIGGRCNCWLHLCQCHYGTVPTHPTRHNLFDPATGAERDHGIVFLDVFRGWVRELRDGSAQVIR